MHGSQHTDTRYFRRKQAHWPPAFNYCLRIHAHFLYPMSSIEIFTDTIFINSNGNSKETTLTQMRAGQADLSTFQY